MRLAQRLSARGLWPVLSLGLLVQAAFVVTPAVLIYPFRRQTPFAVALSYELRGLAPVVTLCALILVIPAAVALASRLRPRWRFAPMMLLVLGIGWAWLARQNHFEWMFEPIANPAYAKAGEAAAFVAETDMVIAVEIAGDAVAYPVRQMAYHHLVNDTVGGVPVVSTY